MSGIRTSSGVQTIRNIRIRDSEGTLQRVQNAYVRDASGASRKVYAAFQAAAAPSTVQGSGNSTANISITTAVASCTPSGGTAPYTYAWSTTDADFVANSPDTAATSFTGSGVGPSGLKNASFICTVTDANGEVAVSNSVIAKVRNTNIS